jgi:hypothetical protein
VARAAFNVASPPGAEGENMRIFRIGSDDASPVEQALADLNKATEKHDRLKAQAAVSDDDLAALKVQAQHAAIGYGTGLDEISHEIAAAEAKAGALAAAVDVARAEVDRCASELATRRDAEQRTNSITEINTVIANIDEPLQRLLVALADLTNAVRHGANISLDAKSLQGFLELASTELPVASAATVSSLKHCAALIQLGSAPAKLPAPETKPVATSAPPPATRSVVAKHDIRYTNDAGTFSYCKQFWDCGLPLAIAERAIAHGVVVDAASDEAKKLRQNRLGTSFNVDFDRCTDIDQDPPRFPDPLPEKWIRPGPSWKYSDVRQTAAPLAGWIGHQSRPTTNAGEQF